MTRTIRVLFVLAFTFSFLIEKRVWAAPDTEELCVKESIYVLSLKFGTQPYNMLQCDSNGCFRKIPVVSLPQTSPVFGWDGTSYPPPTPRCKLFALILDQFRFDGQRMNPRIDDAIEIVKQGGPSENVAHFLLGQMYLHDNLLDKSLQEYELAERNNYLRRESFLWEVQLLEKQHRDKEALEKVTVLEELKPVSNATLEIAALLHIKLGQKKEALRCYEQLYQNYLELGSRYNAGDKKQLLMRQTSQDLAERKKKEIQKLRLELKMI